jgi:hypothetical protein
MYKPMRPSRNVVRKLFKLSSKALKESLSIKVAGNSRYMPKDIALIYISINSTSAD